MEDAYRLIAVLETKTTTKFSCFKADKSFGNIGKYRKEIFQQDYRDGKKIWPDDPDATITLYKESKSNILDKTGWLYDSEIHAGQSLLKRDFPMVDGLHDPAVRGASVTPAASEFIQIINVGRHWVCLSNIGEQSLVQ